VYRRSRQWSGTSSGAGVDLLLFSGLLFSLPVHERSIFRAGLSAPSAEVAFPLGIILFCRPGRADLLALSAADAGFGPPEPEPAEFGSQGEEDPERTEDPADRGVQEDREQYEPAAITNPPENVRAKRSYSPVTAMRSISQTAAMTVATKTPSRVSSRISVRRTEILPVGMVYASSCSDPIGQRFPQNVLPIISARITMAQMTMTPAVMAEVPVTTLITPPSSMGMIGAMKTKSVSAPSTPAAKTTRRLITPEYQRYAARTVPAAMKMIAYVVPAMIPPVTSVVVMSESPSPKRDDKARVGRVLSILIPALPLRMMTKMMAVNRKKSASSVMIVQTGSPEDEPTGVELPTTDVVVPEAELTWVACGTCTGEVTDAVPAGSATVGVACTVEEAWAETPGLDGIDPDGAVEPVRPV